MSETKMSTPWVQYVNVLKALFEKDPDIKFIYDNDKVSLKIMVVGTDKADALDTLLPHEKAFGNVVLNITVVPANIEKNKSTLILQALKGNPVFDYSETIQGPMSNPMTYVVFKKEVVQYYNDNLGDIHGIRSTLYQDLANEIFEDHEGVFFCTDTE